jgi:hypothetical protein
MSDHIWQVYSLIASRDSLTNLEIAQASQSIAKESRKDNQLMLQMAGDSKAIAIATARDSIAMRVIAGVTVLFLPATFVAVSPP